MADDDNETWLGRLGAWALLDRDLKDSEVLALGTAVPGGIFSIEEDGTIEFDFQRDSVFINGKIRSAIGDATLIDRQYRSEYDTGTAFAPSGPGAGWRLDTDYGTGFDRYVVALT